MKYLIYKVVVHYKKILVTKNNYLLYIVTNLGTNLKNKNYWQLK